MHVGIAICVDLVSWRALVMCSFTSFHLGRVACYPFTALGPSLSLPQVVRQRAKVSRDGVLLFSLTMDCVPRAGGFRLSYAGAAIPLLAASWLLSFRPALFPCSAHPA